MTTLQTNMFEAPTHARRNDPSTSHEAAAEVERSGSAKRASDTILNILKNFGPCTTKEVSAYSSAYLFRSYVDYETCHKRMFDLKKAELVELTGEKRGGCRVWRAKDVQQKNNDG